MRYSSELKEKISRQLFPPDAKSLGDVSDRTGIPKSTLFGWKNKYKEKGRQLSKDSSSTKKLTGKEKFTILIETANLNEHQLSGHCRTRGLYPEQIKEWKNAAITANESSKTLSIKERKELNKEKHKVKKLQKELNRKEKALAETAALLVLKKKAQAIWGEDEED